MFKVQRRLWWLLQGWEEQEDEAAGRVGKGYPSLLVNVA